MDEWPVKVKEAFELTQSDRNDSRKLGLMLLGQLLYRPIRHDLIPLLYDEEQDVRLSALKTLEALLDSRVNSADLPIWQQIFLRLGDTSPIVHHHTSDLIGKLDAPITVFELAVKRIESASPQTCCAGIQTLIELEEYAYPIFDLVDFPQIEQLKKHNSLQVRLLLIKLLSVIDTNQSLELLLEFLSDTDEEIILETLSMLGDMSYEPNEHQIAFLLETPNPNVQLHTLYALEELGMLKEYHLAYIHHSTDPQIQAYLNNQ